LGNVLGEAFGELVLELFDELALESRLRLRRCAVDGGVSLDELDKVNEGEVILNPIIFEERRSLSAQLVATADNLQRMQGLDNLNDETVPMEGNRRQSRSEILLIPTSPPAIPFWGPTTQVLRTRKARHNAMLGFYGIRAISDPRSLRIEIVAK